VGPKAGAVDCGVDPTPDNLTCDQSCCVPELACYYELVWIGCFCPNQGGLAPGIPGDPSTGDGAVNVLDVVVLVNYAFRSGPLPARDATCSINRGDLNCDGVGNVLDVVVLVNVAFGGGDPTLEFCNPCAL
jgi:hypothetical protein